VADVHKVSGASPQAERHGQRLDQGNVCPGSALARLDVSAVGIQPIAGHGRRTQFYPQGDRNALARVSCAGVRTGADSLRVDLREHQRPVTSTRIPWSDRFIVVRSHRFP
jgi:hypothetical protein